MFEDTYFLDQKRAIEVAKEQNRRDTYTLQVCYYNGDKLDINLPNLIHLPFDNLIEGLAQGTYRLPTKIDLSGLNLSPAIKHEIYKNFNIALQKAQALRDEYNKAYQDRLKNYEPNFDEKPWRFYLPAHASTRVMQYVSKAIADTLKDLGYEVLFDLDYGINDIKCVKNIFLFKPHAIIQINHLVPPIMNDNVFGFTWFQDMMPILLDNQQIKLRSRDFIFYLTNDIFEALKMKKVPSAYQSFCINTKLYKKRKNIKKEDKIVFIGSSYLNQYNNVVFRNKEKLLKELFEDYLKNGVLSKEKKAEYANKYNISTTELRYIINYLERDKALLYIAQHINEITDRYKLEIYGWGLNKHKTLKPYYKGVLKYGEEISKVYNSAKYSLVLGGYVLQQRTLESAASGCIPIVVDSRINSSSIDETCFEDSLVFIRKLDALKDVLAKEHNVDLECIVNYNSYETFVKKIIKIIKDNI